MFFGKTVFFATIKIIWWNPGQTWAGRRASHILSSSHCIHLSNVEIDHNSHLRWNSSITLPLIKCYSWKSAFPDLWVRAKSQNHQAVLSLRAECRIIPFCHSASILKVGGPVRGQQSHWSEVAALCSDPFGPQRTSMLVIFQVTAPRYQSKHTSTVINYVLEWQHRVSACTQCVEEGQ